MKRTVCITAVLFGLMGIAISGCRIQMTAEERLNAEGKTVQESQNGETENQIQIREPENQKASVLTVSYKPYSLTKIASVFWGMSESEVNEKKETDTLLYMGTEADIEYYGKNYVPHISVFDGNTSTLIFGENDANIYSNIVLNSNDGEWYTYSNENLSKHFEWINEKQDVQKEAESLIDKMKQLDLSVASWDCYYLSKAVLDESQMLPPGYERDDHGYYIEGGKCRDWTDQDEAYCFLFHMAFGNSEIADVNGESLMQIIYVPARDSIIYVRFSQPAYNAENIIKGDEMDVLPTDEVLTFAREILKEESPSASITALDISYIVTFGSSDYSTYTTQLTPVWKVNYETVASSGQTVTDYLLLDAKTGSQYRDSSPLF